MEIRRQLGRSGRNLLAFDNAGIVGPRGAIEWQAASETRQRVAAMYCVDKDGSAFCSTREQPNAPLLMLFCGDAPIRNVSNEPTQFANRARLSKYLRRLTGTP